MFKPRSVISKHSDSLLNGGKKFQKSTRGSKLEFNSERTLIKSEISGAEQSPNAADALNFIDKPAALNGADDKKITTESCDSVDDRKLSVSKDISFNSPDNDFAIIPIEQTLPQNSSLESLPPNKKDIEPQSISTVIKADSLKRKIDPDKV